MVLQYNHLYTSGFGSSIAAKSVLWTKRTWSLCKNVGTHECTNTQTWAMVQRTFPPDTHAHTNNYCLLLSVCAVRLDSTASTWFMMCFTPHGLRLRCDPVFFILSLSIVEFSAKKRKPPQNILFLWNIELSEP